MPDAPLIDAHARRPEEVAEALSVDPLVGLSAVDAAARLAVAGPNLLEERRGPSLLAIVWKAATEPFVLLLAAAGLLAVLVREVRDGLLVLAGLIPIVGADVVTAYRGERALEALREASAPTARVRRGGEVAEIDADGLVPGDVVLLRVGDVVPADLRVVEASSLIVDRSLLTGESVPEPASIHPDPPEATAISRRAVVFAGMSIVGGHGTGIVVATGAATELGRIAGSLGGSGRRRSPLQLELDRLVRILLFVAIGVITITAGMGFLRGRPLGENVLVAISGAIAAIPEEPPVLLAVILGLGAYRLLKRGVLVRRLNAEETLGAVDLIVTDKTGTLTENRLALVAVSAPDGPLDGPAREAAVRRALEAEVDAWEALRGAQAGSFARALTADLMEGERPSPLEDAELLETEPFADGHPYSATVVRRGGQVRSQALGAPEAVLALSGERRVDGWHALVAAEAAAGRRLLVLAERDETGWRPAAMLVFADRLRDGIPDAMAMALGAGIQTIVVTGDHPGTASSIARQAGMPAETVVTGDALATWDDATLRDSIATLDVVARALPEQKLRIVDAARTAGRMVAVTGDGVNDAPALDHADVAVAMGSGTAVARQASDLVLGDDSFATLLFGVREGRRIVANVQKGLVFLISTHVALLGFLVIATVAGFSQPLLPLQILWLELFIDLATSIAFEREPEEPGAMRQPPRRRGVPLLTRELLLRTGAAGSVTALLALALMASGGAFNESRWWAYTAIAMGQIVRSYGNRSLTIPVLRLPPNGVLAIVGGVIIAIQVLIPYIPPLADAFRAVPLSPVQWLAVAGIALGPAVVADVIRRLGHSWVA